MISKSVLEILRKKYPPGTRVELIEMNDPYTNLKPGDKGTVTEVDDTGTIFVNWDSGSGLGIVYGIDLCKPIFIEPNISDKIKKQILAIYKTDEKNMLEMAYIKEIALREGYLELLNFIEENPNKYIGFLLTGKDSLLI